MKRILFILCSLVLLGACRQEDRWSDAGEGTLLLDMRQGEEVKVVSRAEGDETADDVSDPAEALKETARVRVFQGNKLIRKYKGWDGEVTSGITLASGDDYKVRVTAGDSVAASFDRKFYAGEEPFVIAKGQQTTVNVTCNIANALVKVNFDKEFDTYLKSAEVNVAVDAENGGLNYQWTSSEEAAESPVGYYTFPQGKKYFICTLTGVTKSGEKFTQTDRIENAEEATLYTLTYNYGQGGEEPEIPEQGGSFFELQVDETPLIKREESVGIYQRPVIRWTNDNVVLPDGEDWTLEPGTEVSLVTLVSASSVLSQVTVEGSLLAALDIASGDLLDEAFRLELQNKGIDVALDSESRLTVNWNAALNALFENEGVYELTVAAADANNKSRTAALSIVVSDSNVRAIAIPYIYEIWADRATLYAEVIEGKNPTGTLTFRYRQKGTGSWTEGIAASREGNQIKSVLLTGLVPGTTYEYQVLEDTKVSNVIQEFTTETAVQLPNAGFEKWSGSTPMLIYGSGEEMFWDSGNHGSATLNIDVTTSDSSIKHGGSYSAKLKSAYPSLLGIGKFAAGNLFIGKYLATSGTNGVLGWGRPFTTRPLALRGHIRYVSGTVDRGGNHIANDQPDQGIVYIALTDGEPETYDDGSQWAFIVKTADPKLFDPNAENVLAYGEQVWTSSTDGSGMVEFTIPLDYRATDRIPARIILVASASRYGDYFEGSTGSTMWLDDLELIYEESELEK